MSPIDMQMEEALRYHRAGELTRANKIYAAILEAAPDHPDALHLSGVIAHQTGRQDAAVQLIKRAIAMDPKEASFYVNLGNALMEQGHLDEAIGCYGRAHQMAPDSAELCFNLGNAHRTQGNLVEAADWYQKALNMAPAFHDAHNNLAAVWIAMGEFKAAIRCCRKMVELRPDDADTYVHMGAALKGDGKKDAAAACYQKAIHLKPDAPEPYFSLGNLLHEQGRLEAAVEMYQEAISLKPDYIDAIDNLGKTRRDLGMLSEAMSCYERSLQLNPGNVETRFDMATLHLLQGDFADGWIGYEWRFKRENWKSVYPYPFDIPRWQGEPFTGKRLLVHSEQGLGDSLQFVRYLPMVKERGGEVVFETVGPLMNLFRGLEGVDRLIEGPAYTNQSMHFHFYVPLLSLPGVFGTRMETIPSKTPYIYPDSQKIRIWEQRLADKKGFRIGLVWAGKASDRRRSCPLIEMAPLLQVAGVVFLGLQRGEASEEVTRLPDSMAFENIGELFEDFSDTAAAIEHLDLVISIDTSVAHLAGAMNKPVWVPLIKSPDWRWFMDRDDSPWYPTMRLFRQTRAGQWDRPVRQLKEALSAWIRVLRSQGDGRF